MFLRKIAFFIFLSTLLFSCERETITGGIENKVICDISDLDLTESDNIIIISESETTFWKGKYTDTSVKISFTKNVGDNDETETLTFVFNKKEECLQIDRGYKYYNGAFFDVSAVTKMDILDFNIQNWDVDKKITGQLSYRDHHDKVIYNYNFWVEFTEGDYEIKNTNYTYFSNCIGTNLPIEIDLDKDGDADFILGYEEVRNTGNIPNFSSYTMQLSSTKEDDSNLILSPKKNNAPYFILFKPPFSSENTIRYRKDVKNTLEVFYEYDAPYENFNYFLDNNLTYSETLKDGKEDYFLVRMTISDKHYYGWIKFNLNTDSCTLEILETYLHDVEKEHIYVEN